MGPPLDPVEVVLADKPFRSSRVWRHGRNLADRYRELFKDPAPRRLLSAAALSYIGDRFNMIALVTLSYELGDGALGVGGTLALLMLPRLMLQAGAGILVDRFPGRRLLLITQLFMAVIAGSFALLAIVNSLWLLYTLSFLLAAGRTIEMPAFEVRLMSVVTPELRGAGNAAHMVAITIGDLVGPLLGAGILILVGATPLFLINAATFILLALSVARVPASISRVNIEEIHTAETSATEPSSPNLLRASGYSALIRRPDVLACLGLTVAYSALLLGTISLFAERAYALDLGTGGVGLCYTVMGIGTLIGGALSGAGSYMTHRALLVVAGATVIAAIGQVAFGGLESATIALGALALAGIAGDIEETAVFTYFQNQILMSLYGRLFSVIMMANGLGGVVGALAVPLMEREVGAAWALAGFAGITVASAVILAVLGLRPTAPATARRP